jgi:hypothetical protein
VATDADGLLDILTDGRDACIVPKRSARALADAIIELIDRPDERARLAAAARVTAQRYDITAFVRKMEQLYVLLCDRSRATTIGKRRQPLRADLSFLAEGASGAGRWGPESERRGAGWGAPATKQ